MLDAAGPPRGFDVARMMSYEVHGLRVSSSAVRAALAEGDMAQRRGAARPALQHQRPRDPRRRLGRELGAAACRRRFRTLNLRFAHPRPAADGDLRRPRPRTGAAAAGAASPASAGGRRSTTSGRVLLEAHCLRLAGGARRRGRLRQTRARGTARTSCATKRATTRSRRSPTAIGRDSDEARAWLAAHAPAGDRPPDDARPNLTAPPARRSRATAARRAAGRHRPRATADSGRRRAASPCPEDPTWLTSSTLRPTTERR